MESEQTTPVDSIKDVVRSSVKVPKFNKHLKKVEGHIGRNVVEITIKMETIVRKSLMIKKIESPCPLPTGAVEYTDCTLCRGVRPPPNKCPGYDIKQCDREFLVMLGLWGMWSTSSLSLLPGPLWPGMVQFTIPSARAGYDTRSIFKRSLTGLNSEFSFS